MSSEQKQSRQKSNKKGEEKKKRKGKENKRKKINLMILIRTPYRFFNYRKLFNDIWKTLRKMKGKNSPVLKSKMRSVHFIYFHTEFSM